MIWCTLALAALFEPGPDLGTTGEWSNKVILEDLDGDGDLDIVFANGGEYASPGNLAPQRMFRNDGGAFSAWELPGPAELSRSIQAGDLDGDGHTDLFVSAVYQRPSRLFLGSEAGFVEASDQLPSTEMSIGDVELGDVDGDGDLDVVLADWGPGNPLSNGGGPVRLWLNDAGTFSPGTLPVLSIGMSRDLELADIDGDFDLDILVSNKTSPGSTMLRNDGSGGFVDESNALPQFSNNYDFAPMDIDGDADLDLVTINDGNNLREHLFLNDGTGVFENGNGALWTPSENAGEDDNIVVFADVDDDGDPDFVIGSLSGEDRVILNEGTLIDGGSAFGGPFTPGTLGLALGDLDGDGRLDAVMAQGELASTDLVYLGTDIAQDTTAPVIALFRQDGADLLARVHDRMTPIRPSDLRVFVRTGEGEFTLTHRGGDLFGGEIPEDTEPMVCAADRQGNEVCLPLQATAEPSTGDPEPGADPKGSCGCQSAMHPGLGLLFLPMLGLRRRLG